MCTGMKYSSAWHWFWFVEGENRFPRFLVLFVHGVSFLTFFPRPPAKVRTFCSEIRLLLTAVPALYIRAVYCVKVPGISITGSLSTGSYYD